MKKIRMIMFVALICMWTLCLPLNSSFVIAKANTVGVSSDILPCDIQKWYYKIENGKLYKRLYNVTAGVWDTDWIYVRDL